MPLDLPKVTTLSPASAPAIKKALMSLVAWQPAARTTYQFYEELDRWLGPWGSGGYPIGYGKKYNIAFNENPVLNSAHFPVANRWVRQTTINLQVALVDVIVAAIRGNRLREITQEPLLRKAAFDSHPQAYLRGGLQEVAQEEPECIPVIILIPWEQFNPANPNFFATFVQIVEVIREPGIRSWVRTAIRGGGNVRREGIRLLTEEADEALDQARENIAEAERALVNDAKRAVLRQVVHLAQRYFPTQSFVY